MRPETGIDLPFGDAEVTKVGIGVIASPRLLCQYLELHTCVYRLLKSEWLHEVSCFDITVGPSMKFV